MKRNRMIDFKSQITNRKSQIQNFRTSTGVRLSKKDPLCRRAGVPAPTKERPGTRTGLHLPGQRGSNPLLAARPPLQKQLIPGSIILRIAQVAGIQPVWDLATKITRDRLSPRTRIQAAENTACP
jgi:hypothetical protein